MKRFGRVHWLVLVGGVGILAFLCLVIFSKAGPSGTSRDFMAALAKGDADKLAKLSLHGKKSESQVEAEWKYTTQVSKMYRFKYTIADTLEKEDGTATTKVLVNRNYAGGPTGYDQNYALPLQKEDGQWKVDVGGIPRDMFPFLPR